MTFYADTQFFILAFASIIPCIFIVLFKWNLKYYGVVVSFVFIVLSVFHEPVEALYLTAYLVYEISLIFVYKRIRLNKKSKPIFRIFVLLSLMPLICYKISVLFSLSIFGFIGISYLSFKSVQIITEIYDGLITELRAENVFYFFIFFPTFTSGPIDRSRRFELDTEKIYGFNEYLELFSTGLMYLLIGAVYKFVFATYINLIDLSALPKLLSYLGDIYIYGFYLFFDFAGYSFMAMGLGYCFGVKVPKNFNMPFIAIDIKDFWTRWHISLSTWLRDFLFNRVVLEITKKKIFSKRLTTACCGYMINMIVMGFWHGISLPYIIYGLYHGILMCLTDIYQKNSSFYKKHKDNKLYCVLSWFLTFNLVMFGFWIFSGNLI